MPFALAVPLAFVELAGVPTAIGVVHTALALQQTVDHIATVAAAIGQARIGRQQRFAVSASGEQQGKGKGSEWAHSGIRIIERRVCRSRGAEPSGLCAGSITCRSGLARENSQAPHLFSKHALSLTTFASKLAPTVGVWRSYEAE